MSELRELGMFLLREPMPDDHVDFMEDGKWKCIECGCCCASVDWLMDDTNDGICKHLNCDKRCSIYSNRPKECVVDTSGTGELMQAKACSWLRSRFEGKLKEGGY